MVNEEKLCELLKNEEFVKKIALLTTLEDVQDAFEEEGLEISTEELIELQNTLNKEMHKLTANELDVAGGNDPEGSDPSPYKPGSNFVNSFAAASGKVMAVATVGALAALTVTPLIAWSCEKIAKVFKK